MNIKLSFAITPDSKCFRKIHPNVFNFCLNIPLCLLKLEICMVTLTSQLKQHKKESPMQKLGNSLLAQLKEQGVQVLKAPSCWGGIEV